MRSAREELAHYLFMPDTQTLAAVCRGAGAAAAGFAAAVLVNGSSCR